MQNTSSKTFYRAFVTIRKGAASFILTHKNVVIFALSQTNLVKVVG